MRCFVFAALALQVACAAEPTQLLVEVSADNEVKHNLQRIKVFAYAPDATKSDKPLYQQLFSLRGGAGSDTVSSFPFSFGVERGQTQAVKLVVAGYTSTAADADPVIEHKVVADFEEGSSVQVKVQLRAACYMRALQCGDLDRTCTSEATDAAAPGDCVAVAQASGESAPATAAEGGNDAKPQPAPMCPSNNVCRAAEYPCVRSTSSGYSCQGQVAEWPMPDRQQGAKFPPNYDVTTIPGVVIDKVTGLYWQRDVPNSYQGCSGDVEIKGDGCSAREAQAYCKQLSLADGQWRVPSKIELESLLDTTQTSVRIDLDVFPNTPKDVFWTGSSAHAARQESWTVNFSTGFSFSHPDERTHRVRCVRSVLTRNGTPDDRFAFQANTVTDRRTTLEWQLSTTPADTWDEASQACATQAERWRLPTMKELLTLIDPRAEPLALPVDVFKLNANESVTHLYWAGDDYPNTFSGRALLIIAFGSTSEPVPPAEDDPIMLSRHARCVR